MYKNWGLKNTLWKEKSMESYSGYIKHYSSSYRSIKILMLPFCTKNWSSLTSPASNISPGNFLNLWIKVKKEIFLSDYPITSLELQQTAGTISRKGVGTSCWALTSLKLNEAQKENSIKSLTPFLLNYYNPFLFHLFFLLPDQDEPCLCFISQSYFHILSYWMWSKKLWS